MIMSHAEATAMAICQRALERHEAMWFRGRFPQLRNFRQIALVGPV
jgi:hypothetical protein